MNKKIRDQNIKKNKIKIQRYIRRKNVFFTMKIKNSPTKTTKLKERQLISDTRLTL
jgi:hypothetical protein